jgi:hypothetical protein
MAINLIDIFGSEIKVNSQPREVDRQYTAYPGSHGNTAMLMGSRGHPLVVSGTIRAATRVLCETAVRAVESWQWAPATDYTCFNVLYPLVVWDKFMLIADGEGKTYHITAVGVRCNFVCFGRTLV